MTQPSVRIWRSATILLALLFALKTLHVPIGPAVVTAQGGNPLDQILGSLHNIQTTVNGLTGSGGSLATLQSDVTAIKGSIGAGPLNRMFVHAFTASTGQTVSVVCSSTGPFLLHISADGLDSNVAAALNGSPGVDFAARVGSTKSPSFAIGGNVGQTITVEGQGGSSTNPNAFVDVLVTMQTTAGAVVACN